MAKMGKINLNEKCIIDTNYILINDETANVSEKYSL